MSSSNGPEYDRLAAERQQADVLKKAIAKVNLAVATLLAKNNAGTQKKLATACAELEAFKDKYKPGSREAEEIASIVQLAQVPDMDKDENVKLMDLCKGVTTRLFKQMKELLADMKAAKKVYEESSAQPEAGGGGGGGRGGDDQEDDDDDWD